MDVWRFIILVSVRISISFIWALSVKSEEVLTSLAWPWGLRAMAPTCVMPCRAKRNRWALASRGILRPSLFSAALKTSKYYAQNCFQIVCRKCLSQGRPPKAWSSTPNWGRQNSLPRSSHNIIARLSFQLQFWSRGLSTSVDERITPPRAYPIRFR